MGHVDHGKPLFWTPFEIPRGIGRAALLPSTSVLPRKDPWAGHYLFDTPGHEAFTAMRARGAQSPTSRLVLAADDDYASNR
jgi:translation initiation factor IF-2